MQSELGLTQPPNLGIELNWATTCFILTSNINQDQVLQPVHIDSWSLLLEKVFDPTSLNLGQVRWKGKSEQGRRRRPECAFTVEKEGKNEKEDKGKKKIRENR